MHEFGISTEIDTQMNNIQHKINVCHDIEDCFLMEIPAFYLFD